MASKPRKAKAITNKEDLDYIFSLTEDDLEHTHVIMDMFADFDGNDSQKFNPYDTLVIPPGTYELSPGKKNTKPCESTIGIYLFNKLFIEKDYNTLFGYVNKNIDADTFKSLSDEISYALLENETDVPALQRWIQKGQYMMKFASILSPSMSEDFITINDKIRQRKMQLVAQYREEILAGNALVMDKIEKELIAYGKELLKDDPTYDFFDSGAGANWKNNFKNMFVTRGAVKDPDPDKGYNIILSSYMDSIKKEEFVMLANTLPAGPFARSNKTQIGGYWEKLVLSATQHITLDKPGSDCKTKRYITITLNKNNIKDFMYSNIIEGSKLVELNRHNKSKYIGKTVKMRYSAMCANKDKNNCICNACAGNLFYRLTTNSDGTAYIKNVGAATPQLMSRLKNINMKAFHESLVTFVEMDPMKAFEGVPS